MKCPNCQSENRDGAKFCDECGFSLASALAPEPEPESALVPALVPEPESAPKGISSAHSAAASGLDDTPSTDDAVSEASAKGEFSSVLSMMDMFAGDDDVSSVDGARASEVASESLSASEKMFSLDNLEDLGAFSNVEDPSFLDDLAGFSASAAPDETIKLNADANANDADFDASAGFAEYADTNAASADETACLRMEDFADEPASFADAYADPDKTADLSGIERLVDEGYNPPSFSWNAGDTMEMPAIAQTSSASQRDFRAPDAKSEKGRRSVKKIVIAVALVLLVGAIAAGVTYYLGIWGGRVVPDVVGKSQADAIYELEGAGFSVKLMEVKSDDVEGKVLLSDPAGGSRQKQGSEVVIHVSVARVIPSVVGLPRDEATGLFKEEGLENVSYETEFSDEAKGMVLSVSPNEGQKVKGSTHVVVKVATPYVVPDVAGQGQDAACAALTDAGFSFSVVQVYDESVAEGTVLGTDPSAGTELASGSVVTVNVAKSRANELISATHAYFQSSDTFSIDGVTYQVDPSTLEVSYTQDNTTQYSISARVVETHDYLFFGTQTLYGDWETKTGSITWGSDNGVVATSPKIARA